ncbi:MAG: hypothetical protein AABO58_25260 [Acidobacteriota bacterium]
MTPEQRQIAAARQLGVNRPVDEVLDLLRALLDFDATMAAKRKKAGCSIPLAIVVAIFFFVVAGNTSDTTRTIMTALALLCVAAAIAAIVFFLRFRRQDLSDNLRTAAAPFLAVLREDMNAGDPLHVDIDLRPYDIEEKKKKQSEPYKKGAYYKIIDRLFVDPWFRGSVALADGTKVHWKVIEHVVKRDKTKKTSRGKIKSKTKIKRKTVAVVTLGFPVKEYAVKTADDVKRDEKRTTLKLARKRKTDGADSPAFGMLIDLMAEGYKRVSPARSA